MFARLIRYGLVLLSAAALPNTVLAADENCALKTIASLPLIDLPSGRAAVPITVKERPVNLLLDTGTGISLLNADVVAELKLKTQRDSLIMRNIEGEESDRSVRAPIVIGGAPAPSVYFHVYPESRKERAARAAARKAAGPGGAVQEDDDGGGEPYDGLMSLGFFRNVDFDLDFAGKKMTLFSPEHCRGKVVYWPATAVAEIPFDFNDNGHIEFQVRLDGRRVNAILDTGAAVTTLEQGIAQRAFDVDLEDPNLEQIATLGGRPVYTKNFKTLEFEGITVSNPQMKLVPNFWGRDQAITGSRAARSDDALPNIIVGMNLLRKLHIYVAVKERRLYVTPAAKPAAG